MEIKKPMPRFQKELKINCSEVVKEIKKFLINQLKQAGKRKAIIAISGGVDSSVVATLCKNALGSNNVILLQLPYKGVSSKETEIDSSRLLDFLRLPKGNVFKYYINDVVDIYKKRLKTDYLRLGNIMARVRMIYVYDVAKKFNGLVIGTCNKSEILLGYETRYGDGACDINPIGSLYKNQIYQLADFFNLPPSIIKKSPSAELWDGQTDEEELGFSYNWVDPLLYLLFEKRSSIDRISREYGYTKGQIGKVVKMVKNNEFKRLLPPIY